MFFGLACEGATDFAVIESVLCGYFDNDELEDEINRLQPAFDETTQKQSDYGSWTLLIKYLSTERFREDVLNSEYFIVQIDTDVAQEKGFDVSLYDDNNRELSVELLIEGVVERLSAEINVGQAGFYQRNRHKIIFCISVHSIECWLNALHSKNTPKNPKIKGCEKALNRTLSSNQSKLKFVKTYLVYRALSESFLKQKTLSQLVQKEPSLKVFTDQLEPLMDEVKELLE